VADELAGFIDAYHQLVDELDRTGRSDPETMGLLGSLVAGLIADTRAQNWTQLKQLLDNGALKDLVETLNASATVYQADGKPKAAFVARLLAGSAVAGRIPDPRTHQRDQLLNHFIDTAAYVYITGHTARAASKG
jgi:hypothetical protein